MKRIYIVIKGNVDDAHTALNAHGVNSLDWLTTPESHEPDEPTRTVGLYVKVECEPGIIRWFCETSSTDLVPGFGFPVGTLLHYATVEGEPS